MKHSTYKYFQLVACLGSMAYYCFDVFFKNRASSEWHFFSFMLISFSIGHQKMLEIHGIIYKHLKKMQKK